MKRTMLLLVWAIVGSCLGCRPGAHDVEPQRSTVRIHLRDAKTGAPISGRVGLFKAEESVDIEGRSGFTGWSTRRQTWLLGGGEISWTVSADSELTAPPGDLRLVVNRGLEYVPHVQQVELEPGRLQEVEVQLERWIDLERMGWRSADFHLHIGRFSSQHDGALRELMISEGLDVAALVDWSGRATGVEPPAATPLRWPTGTLRVRSPDQFGPMDEPYVIGGREIEDAWPDGKQVFISSTDLSGDDRQRVFVLGGSAAFGYPYRHESSFAVQLERARPRLRVVNVGQVGWVSGHVLAAAERILETWNPRALVVYSGNNEWIQWSPRPEIWQAGIEAQLFLAHSRTLAGALWLGHRRQLRGHDGPESSSTLTGFEHAIDNPDRELSVTRWQRDKAVFLENFREHLDELRRQAKRRDVPVVFLTVPFNYRLSPSWKHRQPGAFDPEKASAVRGAIERAGEAVGADRCSEVLPLLDEALGLDPEPAVLHYLRAVCLERQGSLLEAETAYARSREAMVGNLGSRLSVNDVIRDVASAEGATVLDIRRLFDELEHRRGHHFNEELVHDDCHPTPLGHRLIAESLAELFPAPETETETETETGTKAVRR